MLSTVNLSLTLEPEEYKRSLIKYQVALHEFGIPGLRPAATGDHGV